MLCDVEFLESDVRAVFLIEAVCLRTDFDDKATLICNAIPSDVSMRIHKCDHCDNITLRVFADAVDVDEEEMKQLANKISDILKR
jgi:hypothetical protein